VIHDYGFCFFGLPPFLPLIRACSFPSSVVGPLEQQPCHLHRPEVNSARCLQGIPALVLASQGGGGLLRGEHAERDEDRRWLAGMG
jgi:hypothetical protein